MKMQITIKGDDIGVWDLDDLDLGDAFLIKNATGLAPAVIARSLGDGDPDAWRAVVWFLRRKREPGLALEAVNFKYGDIDFNEVEEAPAPLVEAGAPKAKPAKAKTS